MAGCDSLIVMILLSLSQFFSGFAYAGFYNPNILDLAPPFAGTLFGISNTIGNINGRDPQIKTNPGPSQTGRSPGLANRTSGDPWIPDQWFSCATASRIHYP